MLKMLEPMMFPKTTSWVPLGDITVPEIIFTTSSGADVPMATIVRPIAISETLNLLAREEAPLTNRSAPFISKTKPTVTSNRLSVTFKSDKS